MCRPIQTAGHAYQHGLMTNIIQPSKQQYPTYPPDYSTISMPKIETTILPSYPPTETIDSSLGTESLEELLGLSLPNDTTEETTTTMDDFDDEFSKADMSILYGFLNDTPDEANTTESAWSPCAVDNSALDFNMMDLIGPSTAVEPNFECFKMEEPVPAPPIVEIPVQKSKRLCKMEGCPKRSRSQGLCIAHGGGRRCTVEGCNKSSQGGSLCIRHGGGKRCEVEGCSKAAQTNSRCKSHGGGPRCRIEGCTLSSQGGGLCRTHGGGKRCHFLGCTKGTQRGDYCALHGGSKLCNVDGCHRNDRGGGFCATHGGGKRCTVDGCSKPCRRQGKCSVHLRLLK